VYERGATYQFQEAGGTVQGGDRDFGENRAHDESLVSCATYAKRRELVVALAVLLRVIAVVAVAVVAVAVIAAMVAIDAVHRA
jgi:hypothetical protein